MVILVHETDLDSAISIINSRRISGIRNSSKSSYESYPHFYVEKSPTGRNFLGGNRIHEVTLYFESNMNVIQVEPTSIPSPHDMGNILSMNGMNGEFWQAVIVPGSPPIRLMKFSLADDFEIDPVSKSQLEKACKARLEIRSCFYDEIPRSPRPKPLWKRLLSRVM